MTDAAFFNHLKWTPANARIRIAGVDYYMPISDIETTPVDVENAINIAIAPSGVLVAWNYVIGGYTFASAGVFAMEFYGNLASLLGFSANIWGGAAIYQSDVRPLNWWRNRYPIADFRPAWRWDRGIVELRNSYRAIQRNPIGASISIDTMVDIEDIDDFRAWVDYALLHRGMTFWFDVTFPGVVWSINAWYGRREQNYLTSVFINERRISGLVERLYMVTMEMEVIDGA
jgi:hypothetical protein